jgi:large subunit ribosomal protein L25
MQRVELEVTGREATGKGAMRRMRAAGAVPAVVYGSGSEPMVLKVDAHALDLVLRQGANQLIDLKGAGKARLVLLRELQRDPVSQDLIHADFYQVDTKKKIHVSVPVHLEGKPHGVEMGGVLEPLAREVEVECLPLEIPDPFQLDVSALDIGDSLHASDLEVPEGVVLLVEDDLSIVHVIAPRVVEEETEDEEEVLAEGAEAPAAEGEAAPAAEGGAAEKASE